MGKKSKSKSYEDNHANQNTNDNLTYYLKSNTSNYNPIYTNDIAEIKKPRHSDADTISYISAIPLETILTNDEDSSEDKDLALQNILSEIEYEIASLATVEKGSQFIEQILTGLNNDLWLKKIISGFMGYIVYLSTNRFGSHVLQTLLNKITNPQKNGSTSTTEDGGYYLSMEEYIINIGNELKPFLKELMIHVCGSHVLRSFICAVGGVTLVKNKYRKMDTIDTNPTTSFKTCDKECLYEFIKEVLELEGIQEYACHNSASPFLNIALQVLAYTDQIVKNDIVVIEEDSKSFVLIQKILENKTVLDYSKDAVGSTMLEAIFQYKLPNEYFTNIIQNSLLSNLTTYIQHNISNHIFQSLLTSPSITQENLTRIFQALETTTIQEINCLKYSLNKRRGVFWKLCQVCVRFQVFCDKLIHCVQSAFYDDSDGEKKKKKHRVASIQTCIPKLLFNDGGMDANGARIVNELLQFYEGFPKLVLDVMDGILNLSVKELDSIIKDGRISRCIIDGILEHKHKSEKTISSNIQKFYTKLQTKWIFYAIDRIGKFTVLKLYPLLNQENQFLLVQELAEEYSRLQGCGIGQKVSGELGVDDFITLGEHAWRQKYLKGKKEFVVDGDGKKKSRKKRKKEAADGDDNKVESMDSNSKKKKKKKKRHD